MYPIFDTSRLKLCSLSERVHDLDRSVVMPLARKACSNEGLAEVAKKVVSAAKRGSSMVLMIGGHVLRSGVQRYLIDLIEKGYISCVAMNGSCIIHDYEFALIGKTTESVAEYIRDGRFGFWKETGDINDVVSDGCKRNMGIGEAVGKAIAEGNFPNKDISILASGYRSGVLMTVHVGIGYDIIHQHPNFDGSAFGAASYIDFLRFAKILERLEGGGVMNFGSAVMGPEVFLKALSMVRNVARQKGKSIRKFTALVCDLHSLPQEIASEAPKHTAAYYFRPWKTLLVRTVADGGISYYVKGDHRETIPELWTAVREAEG